MNPVESKNLVVIAELLSKSDTWELVSNTIVMGV